MAASTAKAAWPCAGLTQVKRAHATAVSLRGLPGKQRCYMLLAHCNLALNIVLRIHQLPGVNTCLPTVLQVNPAHFDMRAVRLLGRVLKDNSSQAKAMPQHDRSQMCSAAWRGCAVVRLTCKAGSGNLQLPRPPSDTCVQMH
jgi:hypothetical protein